MIKQCSFLTSNFITHRVSNTFLANISKRECFYVLLMGLSLVLGSVRPVAYAKILSPEKMGYFAIAMTIASYGALLNLGILSGLNRELPIVLGKGDRGSSSRLVGETTLMMAGLMIMGLIAYVVVIENIHFANYDKKIAFYFGGIISAVTLLFSLAKLRLRAEQKVVGIASTLVSDQLITLVGGVALALYFGFKGPLFIIIASSLFLYLYVTKYHLSRVDYRSFNKNEVKGLFLVGFPIMLSSVVSSFKFTLDRLFLIKAVSAADLGIYQLGVLPLSLAIAVTVICNQYVAPKLLYRYGQGHGAQFVFKRAFFVSTMILVGMLLSWPVAVLSMKYVVHHYLQDYEGSIAIFSIFYAGAAFTAANIVGVTIIAVKRPMLLLVEAAITGSCILAACSALYFTGKSMAWYAMASVGAQMLSYFMITGISYSCARSSRDRA